MPGRDRKVYDLVGTATGEDSRIRIAVLLRRHSDGEYMWSEDAAIDIGDDRIDIREARVRHAEVCQP